MRHSNREQIEKLQTQQPSPPQVVKQKGSLFNKLKASCCLIVVAGLIAGGLYLYRFYQDVRAQIDIEVNKNKEVYEETQKTIENANENYEEINAAVEHGKKYLNKAEELKDEISN